jgi:ligand-binding SRPBCC domain-containing protein
MHVYQLKRETKLNASLDQVWTYFSRPENLNDLTPDDLQFEILSEQIAEVMYPGMIINYRISPFKGVKFRWTTEIVHCVYKEYFVDEQRFGPYAFWHHRHHFEQKADHVLMIDEVNYALPFGILGRIMQSLYIKKKLEGIFNYREKKIREIF